MPSPEQLPSDETCSQCGRPYSEGHKPDCPNLLAVMQEHADIEAANAREVERQMADIAAFHNEGAEVPEAVEVGAELSSAERAVLLREISSNLEAINRTVSEAMGRYEERRRAARPAELPDLEAQYSTCMNRSAACRASNIQLQPLERRSDAELAAFNDQQLKPCLQAWEAFVCG